ncbi:phospholipase D family protein [Stenotrophomonas geniculata]|uniref:phospholipase D family protein n=1 Tax=Stenotrophomonas geniculata TaxID=86188 RepID=UPI002E786F00|nr:phospholipase D family protein [Stenotrophomonas geniculata]
MAIRNFILQGFTAQTHKTAIHDLFDVSDVQRVIVSVAFVNSGGVELLEEKLRAHRDRTIAYVGIRNDITTIQGARRLFDLGVSLYTVDTGTRRVTFHPKIYLVRGTQQARLIVGSANLTPGGLNNNIEAGIMIECDLRNATDRALVEGIEASFDAAQVEHPDNITRITTAAQLDSQHEIGLLLDEMAALPPRPSSSGTSPSNDKTPRIKLKIKPIFSSITAAKRVATKAAAREAGATSAFMPVAKGKAISAQPKNKPTPTEGVELELVWRSKELTRRDLDVPMEGRNTNRTGSVNLDKGLLPENVDHRHYFRDDVFDALDWTPSTSTVDEAFARFQLVVRGVDYGAFDLRIAHTTSTNTRSYQQRNAMTRLSWGLARDHVANPTLIGGRLSLYRDNANPKLFLLEID